MRYDVVTRQEQHTSIVAVLNLRVRLRKGNHTQTIPAEFLERDSYRKEMLPGLLKVLLALGGLGLRPLGRDRRGGRRGRRPLPA